MTEMQLFLAICEDRHIDSVVRVFDARQKAIDYAKTFALRHAWDSDDLEESHINGWEYHCTYSCEGDNVRVESVGLNYSEYLEND